MQPEQLVQPVKHIHTTCATCASCATCTLQQVELGGWLRNCQQDERHVNVVFEQDTYLLYDNETLCQGSRWSP